MPEINRYFRQQTIPGEAGGVPVNPEMAGMPAAAVVKFGQTLANTGEAGMRYAVAEQRARAVVEEANVKAQLIRDNEVLNDQLSYTTDPKTGKQIPRTLGWANFLPETKDFHEKNMEKYRGMVTDNKTWQLLQPYIAQHQEHEIISVKALARKMELNRWKEDWLVNRETVKGAYIKTGDPSLVEEFKNDTMNLIRSGAIGAEEGMSHLKAITIGGDTQRIENAIDANPQNWITKYGNIEKSLPELQKQYPYLDEATLRKANAYAFGAARQARELQHWAIQEEQKKNESIFMQKWVNTIASGKQPTAQLYKQWLDEAGYDPANGKETLSLSFTSHIEGAMQARQNHLEMLGRQEPKMTPELWEKYGEILDKIHENEIKYSDIAKSASIFPNHIIMGLMGQVTSTAKVEQKPIWDYINSLKKMFGPQSFGELKYEVTHMMQDKNISPKDYFKNAQDIAAKKYSTGGNINQLIQERLNPFGGKPAQAKPAAGGNQIKANVRGNTLIYNGMEYEIINGEVTIAGQKYKVNQ